MWGGSVTQRSVKAFDPPGFDLDKQHFDDADIETILAAVGLPLEGEVEVIDLQTGQGTAKLISKRQALEDRLNTQAQFYFAWDKPDQSRPTPVMLNKKFEQIRRAADRLLEALFDGPPPESFDHKAIERIPYAMMNELRHSSEVCVHDDVEAVYRLHARAATVSKNLADEIGFRRPKRHQGDQALNSLIKELIEDIWIPLFERQPTFSRAFETDEVDGPLPRFIEVVLNKLGIKRGDGSPLTREAIGQRIKRIRRNATNAAGSN